jgi:ABC-2 type transport system ATP-binding protein
MSVAIETVGLRRSYGDQVVLDGVDLRVETGSTFSLLGPNGAGKTTMVNILSTLITADAGVVRVAGHDVAREPDAVRAAIGMTGQFSAVDGLLTGAENLHLMARLHHLPRREATARVPELLESFDLVDAARKTRRDVLRRHEAPPGPRDDAGRRASHPLPRRADHRA